jgi:GNAT superfamily N-acetyltransferase
MTNILSRIYEVEKDFQTIIDLIARIRPPEHLHDYPIKVDIEENLASSVIRANTRLWFDDDQPVAWAYVDEFNNLHWELDTRYEERIGAEIIVWGEACIRKTLTNGDRGALDTSCRADYTKRILFLQKHSFHQTEDITVAMTCLLAESIAEPKLPPGFIIRPVAGIHEAEAIATMHRAAFGTNYMTTENRLAIMKTSDYDPSLDLIIVAPDGTIAGNCICSVNEQERRGKTDPVATHPRFQRMGLARALLLTGLRLLKERGATSAHLGTSGENIAMQKTAEAVGFTIQHKTLWFSKEVK